MKSHQVCCLMLSLLVLSGCTGAGRGEKRAAVPTSVEFPRDRKSIADVCEPVESFLSLLNKAHPGNRIGYRLQEYEPIAYGDIPEKPQKDMETVTANALEKQYAGRAGVFVYTVDLTGRKDWSPQSWTYYIVPVADGFEMLWVIATKDKGLNEYYSAQQCFRFSGMTNRPWRRAIAESPAFSEYDLWAKQDAGGQPRSGLSFVRRDNKWASIPPVEKHIVCRTPVGLQMDLKRSSGDLTKIAEMKPGFSPRQASRFEADVDSGLVIRSSADNSWVCALYWEHTTHISDHHPADCLHTFVNLGPMPPESKRAIRGRIYWMKASKDELFERWQKNWMK